MDKIYSRRMIKTPKLRTVPVNKKKIKKMYFTLLILLISIITGYNMLKSIDPVFEGMCIAKAQGIATEITNIKSSEVLAKYNYHDTVKIMQSEDGKNSILKTDIVMVNEIISDIAVEIQKELNELEDEKIKIPIGALTGIAYFAGSGPNIEMKIISAGDITTDIKTEFESVGINQSLYRIYLNIECNVSILTSYKTIATKIINQVLLVETVVVGDVPETYLKLENK